MAIAEQVAVAERRPAALHFYYMMAAVAQWPFLMCVCAVHERGGDITPLC